MGGVLEALLTAAPLSRLTGRQTLSDYVPWMVRLTVFLLTRIRNFDVLGHASMLSSMFFPLRSIVASALGHKGSG